MTRSPALKALERDFQSYVRARAGAMVKRVVGSRRASAKQRLGVYADAYRLRLTEVLADDYPALKALSGEPFDALCLDYIDAHPSKHFNARWFGAKLPAFLARKPWSSQPAFAELARLEWAMTLVFDRPDQAVAGVEAPARLAPEQWGAMRVVLAGAHEILKLRWNAGAIRQAWDRQQALPAAARLAKPENWIVWRQGFDVLYRKLTAEEAVALACVRKGGNFAEVCEALSQDADSALRAAAMLRRWLEEGLVADLQAD